jgi:hypothetical protein
MSQINASERAINALETGAIDFFMTILNSPFLFIIASAGLVVVVFRGR